MDNKNFDQHLKSVLENLEPPYDPASWTALQERLDAAFIEEQPVAVDAVDKAVYHTLERLEVPYQTPHWRLLAERLTMQAARLRYLRLAKLAELSLVLLLLWNFPILFNTGVNDVPRQVPATPPDVPVAGLDRSGSASGLVATLPTGVGLLQGRSNMIDATLEQLLKDPATPPVLSADYLRADQLPELFEDWNRLVYNARPPVAALDLLRGDALAAIAVPERTVEYPIVPVKSPSRRGPFYVAASVNADWTRVQVADLQRNGLGHGGAVHVGLRAGKWGVETGIGYVQCTYTPKRTVEIYSGNFVDGYYGSSLTEVRADLVAVPVKVSRQLARIGKTTVHATAGVTANFAAQKSYDYGTVYYPPTSVPPNFLPDPNKSPQFRQSGRGLLENGRLSDNFYASLDAGIRIERPIAGKRYTAFVEPAFRKALIGNGIGPQREPINTFSVQAGVMGYL